MQKSKTLVGIIGSAIFSTALLSGCSNNHKNSLDGDVQNFPRSKILTVSAKDYCESQGKKLSDYELVGVSSACDDSIGFGGVNTRLNPPQTTEVIVDYHVAVAAGAGCVLVYRNGTALLPKQH